MKKKDLEPRNTIFLLKKLTRLHWVLLMIKEYSQLNIAQKISKDLLYKKKKLKVTI